MTPEDTSALLTDVTYEALRQAVIDAVGYERELWAKYTPARERDQARARVFRAYTELEEAG